MKTVTTPENVRVAPPESGSRILEVYADPAMSHLLLRCAESLGDAAGPADVFSGKELRGALRRPAFLRRYRGIVLGLTGRIPCTLRCRSWLKEWAGASAGTGRTGAIACLVGIRAVEPSSGARRLAAWKAYFSHLNERRGIPIFWLTFPLQNVASMPLPGLARIFDEGPAPPASARMAVRKPVCRHHPKPRVFRHPGVPGFP